LHHNPVFSLHTPVYTVIMSSSSSSAAAAAAATKPQKKRSVPKAVSVEYFASLVRSAATEEEADSVVQAYCDKVIKQGLWEATYVRSLMTLANTKLKEEGHPWVCKHPVLHTSVNAEYAAKKAAERMSPGANFLIDLNEEILPKAVRTLEANMDGEELLQEDVIVSIAAVTGRRIGEVLDPRDGAPQWQFSSVQDDMVTLSFLEKQGAARRPHTSPVLCDRKLVEHGINTVRAHFREEVEQQMGTEDELNSVRKRVNEAFQRMFPKVEAAWLEFSPAQKGERGFTVHCLRAFYGAKLWSIYGTEDGNYLAHLKGWLGHRHERTSAIYEKVRHVSGCKLTTGAAAAAEPEPETEGELIDLMLTRVTNSELLSKGRKRKLRDSLASMIIDIGKEEQKAENAAAAAAKKAAVEAKAAAKKQKA
jgi:Telomere resolvase